MPFDLDAVAAEAAGTGEPFTFTFGGDQYELPARFDVRVIALIGKGDVYDALRTLLGKDQTDRLMASDAVFNDKVFAALIEAYAEHQNVSTGESLASTSS
jgi:hypothetical protein